MTLLPSADFGIRGYPGNKYRVNDVCAHPACGKPSQHTHHCWPRSYLRGQPYEWVKLPDGRVIGNRVGFCVEHHEMLTGEIGGHRARLVWESGVMWWQDRSPQPEGVWTIKRPLTTQPPTGEKFVMNPRFTYEGVVYDTPDAHGHVDGLVCPTCGHHTPDPDAPRAKQERRNTKQWVVTVPDDAEIGADILDSWVEDFAVPLGASAWSSRLKRYHVLVTVLAWANATRSEFIADVASAAERRISQ